MDGNARIVKFRVLDDYDSIIGQEETTTSASNSDSELVVSQASAVRRRWTDELASAIMLPSSRIVDMTFTRGSQLCF